MDKLNFKKKRERIKSLLESMCKGTVASDEMNLDTKIDLYDRHFWPNENFFNLYFLLNYLKLLYCFDKKLNFFFVFKKQ